MHVPGLRAESGERERGKRAGRRERKARAESANGSASASGERFGDLKISGRARAEGNDPKERKSASGSKICERLPSSGYHILALLCKASYCLYFSHLYFSQKIYVELQEDLKFNGQTHVLSLCHYRHFPHTAMNVPTSSHASITFLFISALIPSLKSM